MQSLDVSIALTLILVFLLMTFLMSFVEKISHYQSTRSFMENHFKNTFLASKIVYLLPVLVVIELIAVILLILAILNQFFTFSSPLLIRFALIISAISLLMLLFGQRIAKDYQSAAGITTYFILIMIGFFFLAIDNGHLL